AEKTFATGDGLELETRDTSVATLRLSGRELTGPGPSGFLARDVGADSDIYAFRDGICAELGLRLETKFEARADHIVVEGKLVDLRGKDRAVTLVFALPIDAEGWMWGDDIRRERRISGRGEFSNTVSVKCGATGTWSLYPLAALHDDRSGLALAIDMGQP